MVKTKAAFPLLALIITSIQNTNGTHLQGTFNTKDFFKFLIKFGFQKTDRHHKEETHGYIFGNITSKQELPHPITFSVLPKPYFLEYYQNRLTYDKSNACKYMFEKLSDKAFDARCNPDGKDYLRRVPCKEGELCVDEDTPWNVVKNHQFTYVIQDLRQPSYVYLFSFVCLLFREA